MNSLTRFFLNFRFERPSTSVIVGVGSRPYISCSIATKASEGTKLNDALWAVTKEFISSYLP